MLKHISILFILLVSSIALTTYAPAEVPYGEKMQIDVYGSGVVDTDKLCQVSVYRYSHALGWSSYGGGGLVDYKRLSNTTFIRRDLPIVLANSTPYGYEFCLYLKNVVGDPRLEFFYNNSGSLSYVNGVGVDRSTESYQCLVISEDESDPLESKLLSVSPVQVGFRCYNCESGVNEVDVGYTTGSSSYNSTDGITWSSAGIDYMLTSKIFYVPNNNGLLVHYREGLNQTVELSGSLRGIPFVDTESYQSQLILNAGEYTQTNFKIEEPFVVGDYGYYRMICGNETSTGVFKVAPQINIMDQGYNLMVNVYENSGLLVAGAMLGVLFAILATAIIMVLSKVDIMAVFR